MKHLRTSGGVVPLPLAPTGPLAAKQTQPWSTLP